MKLTLCAALLIATFSGIQAATIQLNDGRVYDGTFLGSNEYSYFFVADGLRYTFPRSKVAWLSSSHANIQASLTALAEGTPVETPCVIAQPAPQVQPAPQAAPEAPAAPEDEAGPEPQAQPAPPPQASAPAPLKTEPTAVPCTACGVELMAFVMPQPELRLPLPDDPRIAKFLRDEVQNLSDSVDPGRKPWAMEFLREAGAEGLAILIQDGLYNSDPSIRAQTVRMLGTLGQENVLRPLIEAYQAAASTYIAPDQFDYINELTDWISQMTAEEFYIRQRGGAPAVADDMVEWWNRNWMRVPRQIDEPQLDPNAPDYWAQLKALRLRGQQRVTANTTAR
jgi:hypothetical protein